MKYYLFIQLFMVGALLQGFGSLVGAASQNVNINKSIKAQQEENQKNRDYNLQLAKMQNEWNLQQWERENEYNNPLNQMARLKAAGLNPNLVYGSGAGQSTAAPSPSLTSGAPSSPVDMSLMAQRPTIGQVMTQSLQNELVRAQIESLEEETKGKQIINESNNIDLDTKRVLTQLVGSASDWLENSDIMHNQLVRSKLAEFAREQQEFENARAANAGITADSAMKKVESLFKEDHVRAIVKDMQEKAKISENDAKFALETYARRLLGLEAETDLKIYEAKLRGVLNDDDAFQGYIANCLRFVKLLRDTIF